MAGKQVLMFDYVPMLEEWTPKPEQILFTNTKNSVIAPMQWISGLKSETLDIFIVRVKKCYNSQDLRDHLCHVLNYFENYWDKDKELLMGMSKIKYMMDVCTKEYTRENFLLDISRYILNDSIKQKIIALADYNYNLNLTYKNITEALRYNNHHAKVMMQISVLMNATIPLIIHFGHMHSIRNDIDDFILDTFDKILYAFDVDIFSKFFETANSNVKKNERKNPILWDKQNIRAKDTITHSADSVYNIILNIMPKYSFQRNIVAQPN